jgi:glycosyltransferase involved in cell wall biosynthesis
MISSLQSATISEQSRRSAHGRGEREMAARLPVSVIIPAYNRAHMLRRALASVWSQRPSLPAEVIVVDDGSTDETAEVASGLGATVIRHPRNLGLSAARNSGLQVARNAWVALLDSDDEWLPHHLASLWQLRGDHVLVTGSALQCGADPAADRFAGPLARHPVVLRSGEQLVYPSNIVPVSASMFRRALALDAGGFRPYHGVVEDFDMWLRLLERGTAICSPGVSIIYHVHAGQMSSRDIRAMQLGHAAAAEEHARRTGGSRVPIERSQAVAAWDNLSKARKQRRPRQVISWLAYLAARRQRLIGLLGILVKHYRVRRRSAELRRAGIGRGSEAAS